MKRKRNEPKIIVRDGVLGFRHERKFFPCELGTHMNPDADALGPSLICEYLGIDTGDKLNFKTTENSLAEGRTAEQWLIESRILLCDIGGGKFDHHPAQNFRGECATSLFYNGVIPIEMRTEKLNNFVRFITNRDTQATAQPFDFSLLCKIFTANYGSHMVYNRMRELFFTFMNLEGEPHVGLFLEIFEEFSKGKANIPPKLTRYVASILEGKRSETSSLFPDLLTVTSEATKDTVRLIMEEVYQNQNDFEKAQVVLKNSPKIYFGNNGGILTYLETDNSQMLKAAMSMGFSVIIIQSPFGTGVFTQIRDCINTNDIHRALVEAEAKARRGNYRLARMTWYNNPNAKQIFNGSRTTTNTVRTALESLEDIAEIVAIVCSINAGYLPYCKGGKEILCSKKCNFYYLEVSMCQEIRRNQKNRSEKTSEVRRLNIRKISQVSTS